MRCGKCGVSPATVEEVRACYAGTVDAHPNGKFSETGLKPVGDDPMNPPSPKQVAYLLGLQEERVAPEGWVNKTEAEVWLMERPDVSSAIEVLKRCQRKPQGETRSPSSGSATSREWTLPAGRYALYEPGDDVVSYSYVDRQDLVPPRKGKWRFYQVDRPTEGRWAGYIFVKHLIGAPGQYRKEPVARDMRVPILEAIEKDPKQAMIDYGLQSGVCGRCSSPLTDPESLARGIGPICAGKMEW